MSEQTDFTTGGSTSGKAHSGLHTALNKLRIAIEFNELMESIIDEGEALMKQIAEQEAIEKANRQRHDH